MLPRALIVPTAAAAADLLRYSVGMDQSTGRYELPIDATVSSKTKRPGECGWSSRPKKPATDRRTGTAVCQRRSSCLSECHPLKSMASNKATFGKAHKSPTRTSEKPVRRLVIEGSQKTKV